MPMVAASRGVVQADELALTIGVDFAARMPIAEPKGRHLSNDVIVVDKAKVIQGRAGEVAFVANSWAAECKQFRGMAGDV